MLWQSFEQQVTCSFFQSWAWVGCLAEERFDDPILIEIRRGDTCVALALFNRRRRWLLPDILCLSESGQPGWDSVFIEHNDVLAMQNAPAARDQCLEAASSRRVLVLSGVDDDALACAENLARTCVARQTRQAPFIDLTGLANGAAYLDRLSANTRYQLRRSARVYAKGGELTLTRAASTAERHEFLTDLARLHQAYWTGRGRAGAFAIPRFVRFHHELIKRSAAVDLLRISAGNQVVGYLQNFCFRGRVAAYQSGLDYANAPSHAKPGMTSHLLAIERYLADGMQEYDFLAGADRYKTSLATASRALHWVTLAPRWSVPAAAARITQRIRARTA